MKKAVFDLYAGSVAALKKRRSCTLCNIFMDVDALRTLLEQKPCLLHAADNALFLLVPYHNTFYDCLYLAADTTALEQGIQSLLGCYSNPFSLRASVVGKDPFAKDTADMFNRHGFILAKKLLRTVISTVPSPKFEKTVSSLLCEEEYFSCISYAEEADIAEIMDILLENFDIYGNSVPETDAILENIRKKQIVILRIDGKIGALQYFTQQHRCRYNFFAATRKKYRKHFLHLYVLVALNRQLSETDPAITRFHSWREAGAKKLLGFAASRNEFPDGVVIYNMVRHNAGMRTRLEQQHQGSGPV